ncbi:hypothetical protein GCM10017774_35410 [Lentzea cavernae]|uniref:Uncharacterized protein n=1 Tax=Lentzea cavernae TaxID=2020703 RepID=A0ABQ3MFG2_9PSEU|nr:hypothetical protein GCM10017774_35410 [Lentzea cavernae]
MLLNISRRELYWEADQPKWLYLVNTEDIGIFRYPAARTDDRRAFGPWAGVTHARLAARAPLHLRHAPCPTISGFTAEPAHSPRRGVLVREVRSPPPTGPPPERENQSTLKLSSDSIPEEV